MRELLSNEAIEGLGYETPFFLFSREKIRRAVGNFRKYFPGAAIHYAMKANSDPGVLRTVYDAGGGFEVASAHELQLLRPMRVAPERIIYGTTVKPQAHIKTLFEYGVDRFAFDAFPELDKIAAAAPGARVYARVAVDDTGSVFRFSEKFGADADLIFHLLGRARELRLRPYGISFHVGSQAANPYAWAAALESLVPSLVRLRGAGIEIEVINLGGGYPCTYASSTANVPLERIAKHALAAYRKLPYRPKLILEPGRAIVAAAATLVTSVIGRVGRNGRTWLFLDAGVYNALYEALAFQGSTRYQVRFLRRSESPLMPFSLAGPTGDSPDVITRDALLPADIRVGDKLAFEAVGAYSLSVSSRFNGFPAPPVHFLESACQARRVAR